MLRQRFPFGQKPFPPQSEDVVEIVSGERDFSHATRIDQPVWTIEGDQSNSIINIELQDIAAIIECFIAIRSPYKPVGVEYFRKPIRTHSEVRVVLIVIEIDGAGVGIGDVRCGFLSKWRSGLPRPEIRLPTSSNETASIVASGDLIP